MLVMLGVEGGIGCVVLLWAEPLWERISHACHGVNWRVTFAWCEQVQTYSSWDDGISSDALPGIHVDGNLLHKDANVHVCDERHAEGETARRPVLIELHLVFSVCRGHD